MTRHNNGHVSLLSQKEGSRVGEALRTRDEKREPRRPNQYTFLIASSGRPTPVDRSIKNLTCPCFELRSARRPIVATVVPCQIGRRSNNLDASAPGAPCVLEPLASSGETFVREKRVTDVRTADPAAHQTVCKLTKLVGIR